MSDATERIPPALADDPDQVSEALEIAAALWEKGVGNDALRWLRRAAEAAADAGNMTRLATLARAAADLEAVRPSQLSSSDLSEVEPGEYDLTCLPLRIVGADGSPARVVLRSRG